MLVCVRVQDVKTYREVDGRLRDDMQLADDLVMLVHMTKVKGARSLWPWAMGLICSVANSRGWVDVMATYL